MRGEFGMGLLPVRYGVRFDLKTGEPKGDLTRIPLRTFSVTEEDGTLTISNAEC